MSRKHLKIFIIYSGVLIYGLPAWSSGQPEYESPRSWITYSSGEEQNEYASAEPSPRSSEEQDKHSSTGRSPRSTTFIFSSDENVAEVKEGFEIMRDRKGREILFRLGILSPRGLQVNSPNAPTLYQTDESNADAMYPELQQAVRFERVLNQLKERAESDSNK